MNVNIISHTPNALETLLYTKNTRLQGKQTIKDIKEWPESKKLDELAYMRDTIQSSWEFVDYIFEINGVTRAFTHQLIRTRQGSYAQESQRTVDVSNAEVLNTFPKDSWGWDKFDSAQDAIMAEYQDLLDHGEPVQDARGLLPTNITTSIIAKFDMRTLHNMALLRLCTRTQGEYQRVFKEMIKKVLEIHPWAEDFFKVHCVWYGTCAFPRYDKCPMQKHTVHYGEGFQEMLQEEFDKIQHEAVPVAKNGRTM